MSSDRRARRKGGVRLLRIAYCGGDYFADCLSLLLAREDVRVLKVFAADRTGSRNVIRMAEAHGIPVQTGPVTESDLEALFGGMGCDWLLSAQYPHRIPIGAHRGLNLHPSLLPYGRGAWPFPWVILEERAESGVTLHKLTERFDAGDIVAQRRFPVDARETHDTLDCKCRMLGPELVRAWLEDPDGLWDRAVPQGEGAYRKRPTAADRTVDLTRTPEEIDRLIRAFGSYGVYVPTDRGARLCRTASCQRADCGAEPGTVLYRSESADGFTMAAAVRGGVLYASGAAAGRRAGFLKRAGRRLRKAIRKLRGRKKSG